jgi:hypothetical protein
MSIWIIFLALLIVPNITSGQSIFPSAANDLLPAFRKDDSTMFKSVISKYPADGTELLNLAGATKCPRIFRYVLNHFPGADPKPSIQLALVAANQPILEVALDKQESLGEYPVNKVLATAWNKKEFDLNSVEYILQYNSGKLLTTVGIPLPEASLEDYVTLLVEAPSDVARTKVAAWLISRQEPFDYSDFSELVQLKKSGQRARTAYRGIIEQLIQLLRDMPPSQPVGDFASSTHALMFTAVYYNDLKELKVLAEDAETVEYTVGNRNLLSYAIANNSLPVIKFLLARGANADWRHAISHASILNDVLKGGDLAVLQTVMPYVHTPDIQMETGHWPVFFCTKSFYGLPATARYAAQRQFYFTALQALGYSGADFNKANALHESPVHMLPAEMADPLARSVAILVLEKTYDQPSLDTYAGKFNYLGDADRLVVTVLCQIVRNSGSLLNNSDFEKAGLFPVILQEAVYPPALRTISSHLYSACFSKNVQKVRWLLNDVPLAYMKRNASLDPDSIRKVIVNSSRGNNENVLYAFLHNEHTPDWSSKSIVKALIAAGSDLYQLATFEQKGPIDLLMASDKYQKYYANEILSGLLAAVALDYDAPDAWSKVPSTGDLYRNSILAYEQDKGWLKDLKNCVKMDLLGPGITAAPNRRVNITGIGNVPLGTFPIESCAPINVDKWAGSPQRLVFDFKSSIDVSAYPVFSITTAIKDASALRANISITGRAELEKMNLSVNSTINVPASTLTASDRAIPPLIFIRNNRQQVVIHQKSISTPLAKNAEIVCDRSKGPLRIEYQANSDNLDLGLEIFGCVQDTEFPDLVVPNNHDILSRMRLYGEIVRLRNRIRSNQGEPDAAHVYNRQDIVVIHLLSEYALQRSFPQAVKEEYDQNLAQLSGTNGLLESLGQFYEQHAVLDPTNVSHLKTTLRALIDSPMLTKEQRKIYTDLLHHLNQDTPLSQLVETYGQLMNSELLQQAERQLDNKKRLDLETALYAVGGHLKL